MTWNKGNQTSSFVAERKIRVKRMCDSDFIDRKLDIANRIYNELVCHYRKVLDLLYEDSYYQVAYDRMKETKGEEKQEWMEEVSLSAENYGLTEGDIHTYLTHLNHSSYRKALNTAIMQRLGSEFYASIKKAVFHKNRVHYRKYGKTNSLTAKKNNTGIIYDEETDSVKFMGRKYALKPVRRKDFWLQEAMTRRVKYCRIVRRPKGKKYEYFLQLILEGTSPQKYQKGKGTCGIDEGTSTVAWYSDKEAGFEVLADGVEKYDKEIRKHAVAYERRRRLANPDCYNENGTIKKGAKFSNRTKGMQEVVMRLKSAYRKKTAFVKNSHGYLTNRIIEQCDRIVKEPMNFSVLAKKSGEKAERRDTPSIIKGSSGKEKKVFKFKKKKRFGRSLNRRSPGLFNSMLEEKAKKYGVSVTDVDIKKYKASQYDHHTDDYRKPELSARGKKVKGKRVQRDLYSGFLLKHIATRKHPDREACVKDFENFLKKQGQVVNKVRKKGDTTKNFGLKYFIS